MKLLLAFAFVLTAGPAYGQLPALRALKGHGTSAQVLAVMGPPKWAILPTDRDEVYSGPAMTGLSRSWFWPSAPGCPPTEVSFDEKGRVEIVQDGGTLPRQYNSLCDAESVRQLTPSENRLCSKRSDASTACR